MTSLSSEQLARLLVQPAAEGREPVGIDPDSFCRLCDEHGITGLMTDVGQGFSLATTGKPEGLPYDLSQALLSRTSQLAAIDLVRERDLRALSVALAASGVPPLFIKGAHLAYTCYPRPDLRPRVDTDLLVGPAARDRAARVLASLGYEETPQSGGDLLMYQVSYERKVAGTTTHVVDLHWRVSNAQRFGACLTHAEILAEAEPIAALVPAVGPSAVHAMLLACVHRVAHHFDTPRLIWSYDLHLLGRRLSAPEWDRLAALAIDRGLAAACYRSLTGAAALFGDVSPAAVIAALGEAAESEPGTAEYLDAKRPHIHRILADFRALGWADRWRLARQHVFPAPAYMRSVYTPASRAPLAVLYLRRAWWGARRWVAHS